MTARMLSVCPYVFCPGLDDFGEDHPCHSNTVGVLWTNWGICAKYRKLFNDSIHLETKKTIKPSAGIAGKPTAIRNVYLFPHCNSRALPHHHSARWLVRTSLIRYCRLRWDQQITSFTHNATFVGRLSELDTWPLRNGSSDLELYGINGDYVGGVSG
jgi:hypothetical protein